MSERANDVRTDADSEVDDLLERSRAAFLNGDKRKAHDLLRKAAMIQPYDEKVWLALLRVVDKDKDRRVCLENILAINPENDLARSQLVAMGEAGTQPPPPPVYPRLASTVRVLWIVIFFMIGILVGALVLVVLQVI